MVATRGRGACAVPSRAGGWRALPAAPGHPPGTAHFPAVAPLPPSAPGGPGEGRRRGMGAGSSREAGEPAWPDRAGGIPNSPRRKVVPGGCGWPGPGVRLGGGSTDSRKAPSPRAARVAPPHAPPRPHLPPPAGTSASADWLMCPWKWLFKKLSQPRKIVISPSSQTLVGTLSRICIPYCGPKVEETRSLLVSSSIDEKDMKFTRKGNDYTLLENENKQTKNRFIKLLSVQTPFFFFFIEKD